MEFLMNGPIDRLLLALNLSNPYKSEKEKAKETVKFRIEDLPISEYHRANMKEIVNQANTVESMLEALGTYIIVNSIEI